MSKTSYIPRLTNEQIRDMSDEEADRLEELLDKRRNGELEPDPHPLRLSLNPGDRVVVYAEVEQTDSVYWNGIVLKVTKGPNTEPGINGCTFTVPCECVVPL